MPPSSSLADYLAKNYLTADPASERPKKKRKKDSKQSAPADGLIIADDDPPDLRTSAASLTLDDEDGPLVTNARSAEFRKKKKSGWKTVSAGDQNPNGKNTDRDAQEADAADRILAEAAASRGNRDGDGDGEGDENAPVVAGEGAPEDEDEDEMKMESGARAGLQTAEQTAAMVAAQEKKQRSEAAKYKKQIQDDAGEETIYRDASGRIINVAMKRAEARRAEQEKLEKEAAAKEALMGDVQRQQREDRRQQLQDVKAMPVARTAEDEDINAEMKNVQRWNDPAAGFLTKAQGPATSRSGKPLYRGGFQPNRYGIRPGHRWDGVDRANGFEKEWFAARNRRGRLEALDYQWQYDDDGE